MSSYVQSYFTALRWNFHDPDALENAEIDLFSSECENRLKIVTDF